MGDGRDVPQSFNPRSLSKGALIPEGLMSYRGLTPGAKLVYGSLRRYVQPNGTCRPPVARIGKDVGLAWRQVLRYLKQLEAAGFIRRQGHAGKKSTYLFLVHEVFAIPSPLTPVTSGSTPLSYTTGGTVTSDRTSKGSYKGSLGSEAARRRQKQYSEIGEQLKPFYDDDDKPTWRKGLSNGDRSPYLSSSQQELRLLCAMRFQEEPDLNLIFSITTLVEQRGWTLPAYIQHLKPRLERCKRPPGPGLLLKVAEGLPLRSKPRPPGYREPADQTPRIDPALLCPRCHCKKGRGLIESEGRVIPCPECNSAAASA